MIWAVFGGGMFAWGFVWNDEEEDGERRREEGGCLAVR